MSSLEKCLFKPFSHILIGLFVFLVLSFISSLQILCINPLLTISANMFSHSVGCLFILLIVSFGMQQLFNLMYFHLFILSFVSLARSNIGLFLDLWSRSKMRVLHMWTRLNFPQVTKKVAPMFSYHIPHMWGRKVNGSNGAVRIQTLKMESDYYILFFASVVYSFFLF